MWQSSILLRAFKNLANNTHKNYKKLPKIQALIICYQTDGSYQSGVPVCM